jgi:hypothetical protein
VSCGRSGGRAIDRRHDQSGGLAERDATASGFVGPAFLPAADPLASLGGA